MEAFFRQLQLQLQLQSIDRDIEKKVALKCDLFLIRSLYSTLSIERTGTFPYNIVCNFWLLMKLRVSFFCWESAWVRILKLD